ncbi:Pentatricopeptide repeat-containing protein [Thalictrum thalictroides]|uniref:Pentatricopeptide repeat-containing protein n=1 Tax=Thalictrum thalictroides TaxID=46969 RepID=A0A7J6X2D1_THATH|nr:Pentatricopeptide repeat-containing protein [Thalictrum thalictroides]
MIPLLRSSTNLTQIHQIHAQIIINGLLPLHSHLLGKLIDLRYLEYARFVFDQISSPTDYSWNSMIRCYTINGYPQDSLSLYLKMLQNDVNPSNFTYPSVLKACSSRFAVSEGEQVHCHVVKFGFHLDLYVSNSLIDMYCKCSCLRSAHQVLDEMHDRDKVSWNSLISGYVSCGEVSEARKLFEEMPMQRNVVCWTTLLNGYGKEGNLVQMLEIFLQMLVSADDVGPNSATMVCLLSACSSFSELKLGRWAAVFIDVNSIPLNAILTTALLDMYSKCGDVEKARKLFDGMSGKNLVSWNAMITGYVQCGFLEEAIGLFNLMRAKLVKPNEITMVNVLSACAGLGTFELGKDVHRYICRNKLDINVIVATALVDMYSKCGSVNDACLVFVKTADKDVALWNAMIASLAYHGNGKDSIAVLTQMDRSGVNPNDITFIGVLSACNHSGLVEEGRLQFSNMVIKHNLSPTIEHYACMVDLLGRAGYLDEAFEMVQNMVIPPDSIIWGTLLSACRIHRSVDLADKISRFILSSPHPNLGFCILLSNIYASAGRWKDVARVRKLVKEKGIKKPFGCSWIEVDGVIHRFLVEALTHMESQEIHETHQSLINQLKLEGYVPNLDFLAKNIDGM